MSGFVLHLHGPMQSWADTGFGQLREAGPFPSRAAVLGIVAAAMGIPRADERLVALHDAFRVHVAEARRGEVRQDYHTVETQPTRPKTLTWRAYHHDAHFVALVVSNDAEHAAQAMAALRRPVYAAFLGRRSCPPSVPLLPVPFSGDTIPSIVEALTDTATTAMKQLPGEGGKRWGRTPDEVILYLDGHFSAADLGVQHVTHGSRRDLLVAPRRAHVNRPFTRLVRQPAAVLGDAPTLEDHFNL